MDIFRREKDTRIPVQTPVGVRSGFGTQPRYQAPDGLRVEISIQTQ